MCLDLHYVLTHLQQSGRTHVQLLTHSVTFCVQAQSLPEYVTAHREAVWAVGPLFAAVTGVAFKEGICYGKPECAALFFTVPALLLGHLSGVAPSAAEQALLAAFVALAGVFAARKYTQPIKDDIGDKSIFECAPGLHERAAGSAQACSGQLATCSCITLGHCEARGRFCEVGRC